MEQKILKLIGFVERKIERISEDSPEDEGARDRKDIQDAARWLKKNLNFIIADAEWDHRL